MKEGIRMMEANNWPRLTPVMRHQREAGEAGLRTGPEGLGGAQGRQCGHGAGAGPRNGRPEGRDMWLNRKGNFGHFGIKSFKVLSYQVAALLSQPTATKITTRNRVYPLKLL